jgi:hypothetical protein
MEKRNGFLCKSRDLLLTRRRLEPTPNGGNKLILLLFFLSIGFPAHPQYNLNFDWTDCGHSNSAIFSQALIEVCGKEKITEWLETKRSFCMTFTIDSLGYVLDANPKISHTRGLINDTIQYKIKDYLVNEGKRFYICYDIRPLNTKDECEAREAYLRISEHLQQEDTIYGRECFPFDMFYPNYNWYLKNNIENPLSIFEYLQQEIDKYLPRSP